jgi:ribonuclease III
MAHLDALLEKLGLGAADAPLVKQALTHSSLTSNHGRPKALHHNERLEYLGDAVLELVISHYLYENYPDMPEGKLTKLRANLVCESTLVGIAEGLGLKEYVLLGKGTEAIPSILADALEALMGAIFLSKGYPGARAAAEGLFDTAFRELAKGTLKPDYKTLMQEYAQEKYATTPDYKIVAEDGPDHDKTFTAQFLLKENVWAEGTGKTKKEAEQAAALGAYAKIENK